MKELEYGRGLRRCIRSGVEPESEVHSYNGIMFDIGVKGGSDLLFSLALDTISVRGDLGHVTVWVTGEGSREGKEVTPSAWKLVHEGVYEPSPHSVVDIKLTSTVVLKPGDTRGLYIHSAVPGDTGLVYKYRSDYNSFIEDDFLKLHPGVSHASRLPFCRFGQVGSPFRTGRQFVGSVKYEVLHARWQPIPIEISRRFPAHFKEMVHTFLLCAYKRDSPLRRLPNFVLLEILKMLSSDWALTRVDQKYVKPRRSVGCMLKNAAKKATASLRGCFTDQQLIR